MMEDNIIKGIPNIVFIAAIIIIIIGIVVLIIVKKKKSKKEESNVSILDVNNKGVPNSSEQKEFSYGFEKEPTVVMNPVNQNQTVESAGSIQEQNNISSQVNIEEQNNISSQVNAEDQNIVPEVNNEQKEIDEVPNPDSLNSESLNAEIPTLNNNTNQNVNNAPETADTVNTAKENSQVVNTSNESTIVGESNTSSEPNEGIKVVGDNNVIENSEPTKNMTETGAVKEESNVTLENANSIPEEKVSLNQEEENDFVETTNIENPLENNLNNNS